MSGAEGVHYGLISVATKTLNDDLPTHMWMIDLHTS